MKIVHVSTSDIRGGAARSAFRLHRALRDLGSDSRMFVAEKCSQDAAVVPYLPEASLRRRFERAVRKERIRKAFSAYASTRPDGFEHFRDDRTEFGAEVSNQLPEADVIHLHWIAGFVDSPSFFRQLPADRPIIWTLHDMNPFTGGCHFDSGCGRYTQQCGACPQLGSIEERDLSYRIWSRKKRLFETLSPERLFLVAPSQWLATEARKSSIFGRFVTTVIPYGIDTAVFSPQPDAGDRLREALEIPRAARVILFLAEYTNNQRKGFPLLDRALIRLKDIGNLFLLSLGHGRPATRANLPHLHLGPIGNDDLLAALYSLADVFVIPSIQDNLPNTVMEAMACGTPTVGFEAGGVPDMIRLGETGLLAPVGNTDALADALIEMLKDPERRAAMGNTCRQSVLERFPQELQARRYRGLYQALSDQPLEPAPMPESSAPPGD